MNKKGAIELLIWITRIIMTTVVIFTIVFLLQGYIRYDIDVFETETSIFANRVLFVKALNYVDGQGRLHSGVVDVAKYKGADISKELEKEIFYGGDNRYIAAKISLENLDDVEEKYNEVYYNQRLYNRDVEIYKAGLASGACGVRGIVKSFYVLIKDGEKTQKGAMRIEILFPNS